MSRGSVVARSVFGAVSFAWCALLATGVVACHKDDPPPPLPPEPAPTVAPTPSQIKIEAEDAGAPPAPSAHIIDGSHRSFAKCCFALLHNAALAPEPNKTYLNSAGNLCSNMVAAGKSGPSIVSAVQGMLRGAGMPAACSG